ncbi:carbonic anhydrase [Christensenellaceae bacterium OttesenSCG-928-L17]|nr:carbonic anhydrase [Christensenellaceae bacterium OttesenSCG-928-L17]
MRIHKPDEQVTSAEEALQLLKEGNARFVSGMLMNKNSHKEDREILKSSQKPFAVVLCCSDSRVAPEIFFDQKLGDLFVIRNAGNVTDETVFGSIEYAVEHLHTPLVVVCGHSCCGAVTAACGGAELPPNIQSIADRIQPAISRGGDVDKVIHNHVEIVVEQVMEDAFVKELGTKVAGAYYDIHTGEVTWM